MNSSGCSKLSVTILRYGQIVKIRSFCAMGVHHAKSVESAGETSVTDNDAACSKIIVKNISWLTSYS